MGQFESGKLAGRRIFGPALSSAVNDFLTRIVQVSGSSLIAESGAVKTAAEIDNEGLEAVVRGVCSHTKSKPNKMRQGSVDAVICACFRASNPSLLFADYVSVCRWA